jgi:hypothetical protein
MVDKIIALGLIDVRDVEEVGEGPLVNEVGMTEQLAEEVVDKCIEEAKLVVKEVEAEKAAKEAAKRSGTPDLLAALGGGASASASADGGDRTPRVGTPEVTGDAGDVEKYVTPSEANGRDVLTGEQVGVDPESAVGGNDTEDQTIDNPAPQLNVGQEDVTNV